MKTPSCLLVGLLLALVPSLPAQKAAPAQDPAPLLQPAQLDDLLGPLALYPDALVALILPAATEPADLVLAARYFSASPANNRPEAIDAQPWDESVRALAHYPELVKWMDSNLAWTQQLGNAFETQPADVMKTIQHLRTTARAAGTLTSTAQQVVIVEREVIRIVPAQPEVIYVPSYDPVVVFVRRPPVYAGSFITFSTIGLTGIWLSYECDWDRRVIWVVDRRHDPRPVHEWLNPVVVVVNRPSNRFEPPRQTWQPPRPHTPRPGQPRTQVTIVRPAPIVIAASPPPSARPDERRTGRPGNLPPLTPKADRRPSQPPRPELRPSPAAAATLASTVQPVPTPAPASSGNRSHVTSVNSAPTTPADLQSFRGRQTRPSPAAPESPSQLTPRPALPVVAVAPVVTSPAPAMAQPVPATRPLTPERRGRETGETPPASLPARSPVFASRMPVSRPAVAENTGRVRPSSGRPTSGTITSAPTDDEKSL